MSSVITFCLKIACRPRMNLDNQSELIKLKRALKTTVSLMCFLFKPSRSLIGHVFFKRRKQWGGVFGAFHSEICWLNINGEVAAWHECPVSPGQNYRTMLTILDGMLSKPERSVSCLLWRCRAWLWASFVGPSLSYNTGVFSRGKGLGRVLWGLHLTLKSLLSISHLVSSYSLGAASSPKLEM